MPETNQPSNSPTGTIPSQAPEQKSFSSGFSTSPAVGKEFTSTEPVAQGTKEAQNATPPKPTEPDVVTELRESLRKKDEALVRIAQQSNVLSQRLQELEPVTRAGAVLMRHPEGKKILAKLERGEQLTDAEDAVVDDASQAPALDPNTIAQIVRTELDARDSAKEATNALTARLESELPDFKQAARNPRFWNAVDMALNQISRGFIVLDPGEDAYEHAFKVGYRYVVAADPLAVQANAEKVRLETTDRAASVLAGSTPAGRGGSSQPVTAQASDNKLVKILERYHNVGANGGRRFSGSSF